MPGGTGRLGPGAGGWRMTRLTVVLWIALMLFVLWQFGVLGTLVSQTSVGGSAVEHALEVTRKPQGASGKAGVAPQGASGKAAVAAKGASGKAGAAAQGGSGQVRICTNVAECVNAR
jgi:hypothetical protein